MRSLRPTLMLSAAALLAAGLVLPQAASAQSSLPRPSELPPAGGPGSRPTQAPAKPAAQGAPAKPAAQQGAPKGAQQGAPAKQAAPQPGPGPAPGQPSPPRPYATVAVTLPAPSTDPAFEALRKQIGEAAGRKDRAALAGLVAPSFFWTAAQGEKADRKKKPIDNLAAAIGLDEADGEGWEILAGAAADPTLQPFPPKKGVSCAPAPPQFDGKAFEQLLKTTRTEVFEWAYPAKADITVRTSAAADAPVLETLGAVLVRVMPDPQAMQGLNVPPGSQASAPPQGTPPQGAPQGAPQGPAAGGPIPPLQVVTPAGKTGYVAADTVLPLIFEQLCYVKDAAGWKIGGYLGGE